jgi:hypothetical protein
VKDRLNVIDAKLERKWRSSVDERGEIIIRRVYKRSISAELYARISSTILSTLSSLTDTPSLEFSAPATDAGLALTVNSVEQALIQVAIPLSNYILMPESIQDRFPFPLPISRMLEWARVMGSRCMLYRKVEAAERIFRLTHRSKGPRRMTPPSPIST